MEEQKDFLLPAEMECHQLRETQGAEDEGELVWRSCVRLVCPPQVACGAQQMIQQGTLEIGLVVVF